MRRSLIILKDVPWESVVHLYGGRTLFAPTILGSIPFVSP